MNLPTNSKLIQFKNTATSASDLLVMLITGPPGAGKTRLGAELAQAVAGKGEVFIADFPEEGGLMTLRDLDIPYATIATPNEFNELYTTLYKSGVKGLMFDGMPAYYEALMRNHAPSGIPPEDHGKTWRAAKIDFKREWTRFKLIPGLKVIIGTSLVWPDKDEITGKEGRNLVPVPGELKGNIYGLFDYVVNIAYTTQANGTTARVLELQPTERTVTKSRVPPTDKVEARIAYDLAKPDALDRILKALQLQRAAEEAKK